MKTVHPFSRALAVLSVSLILVSLGWPAAMTISKGTWPSDWPRDLEALRESARTIEMATMQQENIYEITFKDRETFEQVWPAILSVKTPGAPLTLYKVGAAARNSLISNAAPIVRIIAPSEAFAGQFEQGISRKQLEAEGKVLRAGAPWPKELYSAKGELPEWVVPSLVDGKRQWVEWPPQVNSGVGFRFRARVDLEVVVDGQVIDLNRIPLPPDTPVIDRRF